MLEIPYRPLHLMGESEQIYLYHAFGCVAEYKEENDTYVTLLVTIGDAQLQVLVPIREYYRVFTEPVNGKLPAELVRLTYGGPVSQNVCAIMLKDMLVDARVITIT